MLRACVAASLAAACLGGEYRWLALVTPREGELVVSDRLQVAFVPAAHGELYAGGGSSGARPMCLRLDGANTRCFTDHGSHGSRREHVFSHFLEDDDQDGAATVGGVRERTLEAWFADLDGVPPDCVMDALGESWALSTTIRRVFLWRTICKDPLQNEASPP